MKLHSFLGMVEIRTKPASMIPFIMGSIYTFYHFKTFDIFNFFIMFLSLLSFDMLTTALNNYFDYKRAKKRKGYNYERHNTIVKDNLKESTVIIAMGALFAIAASLGILLVLRTGITVLLIGTLSFGIGILYSFGPVPISRTPLGEILSGFFMGFIIIYVSIFIHIYDFNLLTVNIENNNLKLLIDLRENIYILLLSVPFICGIANIMLANNICDIEDDLENHRYTLPIYIGRNRALTLFKLIYYAAYADIAVSVIVGVVPVTLLLVFITLIPVYRNIGAFTLKQSKKDTFPLAVKNFLLLGTSQITIFILTTVIEKNF